MSEFPESIDGEGILYRDEALVVEDMNAKTGIVDVQMVPYDAEAELIPGVYESFAPGAFMRQVKASSSWARVKLLDGHDGGHPPLGRATRIEERSKGLGGIFQINMRLVHETEWARSVWLAMENGDLDEVSVGFQSVRRGGTEVRSIPGGKLLRRVRAHLSHLALVPVGAYGQGARVLSVRDGMSGVLSLSEVRKLEDVDEWADWKATIARHRGTVGDTK